MAEDVMTRTLRPYQDQMIDWIVTHPQCAIFAFMGSGKTIAVLTALDRLALAGVLTKPSLVIAPLRVARDVWSAEAAEWPHLDGLRVQPVIGTSQQRRDALATPADVYTINYELVPWLLAVCGERWPFEAVVLDESTKVKSLRASIRTNSEGKSWVQGQGGVRAKALLRAMFQFSTVRVIELTGTPAPNGLIDLWSQIFFLDRGKRLGRVFQAFTNRWFRQNYNGWGVSPLPHAHEEITNQLKDICLSLKSEDHFDLEKPIVTTIEVDLPLDARRQYKELEQKLFTEIQGSPIEAFNTGAKTAKLLQMAAGAAYTGSADDPGEREWVELHSGKLDALEDIIEETSGANLLVAYWFKSDLARLLKRFPQARHLDQKSETLKAWNEGSIPILLAHPGSAGHGLNLQYGGHHLVYFSSSWAFEEHAQILERIGPVRQLQSGFKRSTYVYYIIARKTVDEDVMESLRTKRSVQEVLIEGMKRRLNT